MQNFKLYPIKNEHLLRELRSDDVYKFPIRKS